MEKQEKLTMEFVKSLMDESYTLVWVDYRDNLDNSLDTIRKCLKEGSSESLLEKVDNGTVTRNGKPSGILSQS